MFEELGGLEWFSELFCLLLSTYYYNLISFDTMHQITTAKTFEVLFISLKKNLKLVHNIA